MNSLDVVVRSVAVELITFLSDLRTEMSFEFSVLRGKIFSLCFKCNFVY